MRASIKLFLIPFISCLLISASFAVMPPEHYEKRIEESKIKAIAVVESIKTIERTMRHNYKEAIFKLEKSFGKKPASQRFSGTFYSVDHFWQKPGAGGIIHFYPEKGERAYVTISEKDGSITSYTPMTPALYNALLHNPESVSFKMGEAYVVKPQASTERSGPQPDGATAPVSK